MGITLITDYAPADDHEGYTASVLDDGTDTATWNHEIGTRIVGWRPACSCGWRSPDYWARADYPDQAGMPPAELDEQQGTTPGATEIQWDAHLRQALPELAVHDAAEAAATARAELDTAVAAARAVGASWTQIASAADMSRQAAHERWATTTAHIVPQ